MELFLLIIFGAILLFLRGVVKAEEIITAMAERIYVDATLEDISRGNATIFSENLTKTAKMSSKSKKNFAFCHILPF